MSSAYKLLHATHRSKPIKRSAKSWRCPSPLWNVSAEVHANTVSCVSCSYSQVTKHHFKITPVACKTTGQTWCVHSCNWSVDLLNSKIFSWSHYKIHYFRCLFTSGATVNGMCIVATYSEKRHLLIYFDFVWYIGCCNTLLFVQPKY